MREDQPATAGAQTLRGADAAREHVQLRTLDGVAVLTIAGDNGNRFSPQLVSALARSVVTALRDDGVRALVIAGRGPDFCAGPFEDLPPPGPEPSPLPPVLEAFAALCRRIADSPRPVVCALHGRVASAGLALALAAHERLADPRAQLFFPEPRLARLPPGGGAVRLAWRLGAQQALSFLQRERPMPAPAAQAAGLVDRLVDEGLIPAAIDAALARARLPRDTGGFSAPGLHDAAGFRSALAAARRALPHPLPAHRRHECHLIDAVEAAQLLPPDQALDFDLVHAQDAATAPPARALAHLARAARRVLDTPEARAAGQAPPPSDREARLLALPPGQAALLAPPLLSAGLRVTLVADDADALTKALEAVAEAQLAAVAAGRQTRAEADTDWERLEGRLAPDADTPPALVVAEPARARALDAALPAPCPLLIWNATALPDGLAQPGRVIALAPGPRRLPTGLATLIEVVVPPEVRPAAAQAAMDLVIALRLTPVRSATRAMLPPLLDAARRAAALLRAAGIDHEAIRAIGLLPPDALLPPRAGADAAATPAAGPALPLPPERLVLLALINAGATLLESGQALRPSDIDVAMVTGAAFPAWRGGPMAEADSLGPLVLRHELLRAAALDPDLWTPAPLIDQLIRQGWRFEDLNTG